MSRPAPSLSYPYRCLHLTLALHVPSYNPNMTLPPSLLTRRDRDKLVNCFVGSMDLANDFSRIDAYFGVAGASRRASGGAAGMGVLHAT